MNNIIPAAFLTWTDPGGETNVLIFDIIEDLAHHHDVTATEHPVEKGADISDHIRKELDKVTLTGFISNTPIKDWNEVGSSQVLEILDYEVFKAPLLSSIGPVPVPNLKALQDTGLGALKNAIFGKKQQEMVEVLRFDDGVPDLVTRTDTILREIQEQALLVELVTANRFYENMVIEKVELRKDKNTGTGAPFHLTLKQMRLVEVKIVNTPKSSETRGHLETNKGAQEPKAKELEKESVIRHQLGRFLGPKNLGAGG